LTFGLPLGIITCRTRRCFWQIPQTCALVARKATYSLLANACYRWLLITAPLCRRPLLL
jgi:hypothetical protein